MHVDIDKLIAEVENETGLNDWGGHEFRHRLAVLSESISRSDPLPEVFPKLRKEWQFTLTTRLKLIERRKSRPEEKTMPLKPTLIISGLPRTGTTFLFGLLSQDADFRRIEDEDTYLVRHSPGLAWNENDTELRKRHITDHPLPLIHFMVYEFLDFTPHALFTVPDFIDLYFNADYRLGIDWYKTGLQTLQARKSLPRHLDDSPTHLFHIDKMLAAYPGACFVWNHRDPASAIPSVSSLHAHFRQQNYGRPIDLAALGRESDTIWTEALRRGLEYRDSHPDQNRIYDCSFARLNTEPMAVVREIYDFHGFDMSPAAERAMTQWAEEHRTQKSQAEYGVHQYRAEDYGLDTAALRRKFADYRERFGLK